jgi:hypothetical protein
MRNDIESIEVAHAITWTRQDTRLKKFFLRIKARRGIKIGVVALVRKVLCILYHLLIHQEMYHDDLLSKQRSVKHPHASSEISINLDEMIKTIIKAGYEVRKIDYPISDPGR